MGTTMGTMARQPRLPISILIILRFRIVFDGSQRVHTRSPPPLARTRGFLR
jgi:hypothetical protein